METNFKIMFFNVEGIKNKNIELNSMMDGYNLVGLTETWTAPGEKVDFKNFDCLDSVGNIRKATKGRHPGGVACFVELNSNPIIFKPKLHSSATTGVAWVIIEGEKRIGLAVVYSPPRDSDYFDKNIFDSLSNQMAELESKFNCEHFILGGDFNARIGDWQNPGSSDDFEDEHWDVGALRVSLPQRRSRDSHTNATGRDLKCFCEAHNLIVANGANENMDDFFTFISPSSGGQSVIDIVLVSSQLFGEVLSLKILDSTLSHHLPVSLELRGMRRTDGGNMMRFNDSTIEEEVQSLDKYKWKKDPEVLSYLSYKLSMLQSLFVPALLFFASVKSVSSALKVLITLFQTICRTLKIGRHDEQKNDLYKNSPWFTETCLALKKEVLRALRKMRKSRESTAVETYLDHKRRYTAAKSDARKVYWEEKSNAILEVCRTGDSSKIWNEIKKYTGKIKGLPVSRVTPS